MMKRLSLSTPQRETLIDITRTVEDEVAASGCAEGLCVVFIPHTTAGVTINENADPDVVTDMVGHLSELIPCLKGFRHMEGNSDAHIKATLVGSSVTIPIAGGNLALGTWQGVYFCEFDGPRRRKINISIQPEGGK